MATLKLTSVTRAHRISAAVIAKPSPAQARLGLPTKMLLCLLGGLLVANVVAAHDVSPADARLIAGIDGPSFWLYAYLGAKHMVTGLDHLLFLAGVIFYLKRLRTIALFVSLFAFGHSLTLILGVLLDLRVSPFLVDAVIGFSVAYKGFDNLHGFDTLFGARPNEAVAVFVFGLFHGLGLATKLQQLGLSENGLFVNLLSFNVGVEAGQLLVLTIMVFVVLRLGVLQKKGVAVPVNLALIVAGGALMTYQLGQFFSFAVG